MAKQSKLPESHALQGPGLFLVTIDPCPRRMIQAADEAGAILQYRMLYAVWRTDLPVKVERA